MSLHRTRDQFQRASWKAALLLPSWTLQLILALSILALFSWRIAITMSLDKDKQDVETTKVEYAWQATNIAMSFVTGLCTFVEIGKFLGESLTPWSMLFSNVIKTACALAILALDIVAYTNLSEKSYSLLGIALDGILLIVTISMTIYVALAYYRQSTYEDYTHPVNVKGYGFYDNQSLNVPKRISRNSDGSSLEPLNLDTRSRESSQYSHTRDTHYEAYRIRRLSGSSFPEEETQYYTRSPRSPRSPMSPRSPRSPHSPAARSPPVSPRLAMLPVWSSPTAQTMHRADTVSSATTLRSMHGLMSVPEESEGDSASSYQVSLLSPVDDEDDDSKTVVGETPPVPLIQEINEDGVVQPARSD